MAACVQCGNSELRSGARFCPRCGAAQPAAGSATVPPQLSSPPQQEKRRIWRGILGRAGLGVLALAGLLLLVGLTVLAVSRPASLASSDSAVALRPRVAGQRGLDWLLNAAVEWQRREDCYGCHVQSFAVMGAGIGKANRYTIDMAQAQELADYLVSVQSSQGDLKTQEGRTIHPGVQTALGGLGLSQFERASGADFGATFTKMADWFVMQQSSDGHWSIDHHEAPVEQGDVMMTGSALETLVVAQRHQKQPEYATAIEGGVTWLRNAPLETTQDIVFAIMGLRSAGVAEKDTDVKRMVDLLRNRQQEDGGWGETSELGSNGYATGQVLYAFKQAGMSIRDDSFQRGALWLLENQQADGSWQQINSQQTNGSRSSDFATTMWAAIGLGEVFDVRTERVFLSLIHPDQAMLGASAICLFYAIPLLLIAPVVWRRHGRLWWARRREQSVLRGSR